MNIQILAIDKLKKTDPEQILIMDYLKKTRWPIEVREFEEKRPLPDLQKKEAESRLLLNAVQENAKLIALDERGKELTSREFATLLNNWIDDGFNLTFLIGGANGHADTVKQKADLKIAFGRMTMPHLLARVVLAEQLYRAKTILEAHPYHRD